MTEAKVIFDVEQQEVIIQCTTEDTMKDICEKLSIKINKKMNSLVFLHGGNQVNFELKFKEIANFDDIKEKKMNIVVKFFDDENNICPECGQKIKFSNEKLDDLKS